MDELKYCKHCLNAVYETIGEMPMLFCKIRKEHIGFYWKPCKEFK